MRDHIMIGLYNALIQMINRPVTIQDIVVTGYTQGNAGEFANESADTTTQKSRLYTHIENLAQMAALEHRAMNFGNSYFIQPGKENNITRLVTNEFAFYTRNPLSIADFNELQQRIVNLAKELPQNLQLVLSSFAVKTPDNKIMNVVAQVDCGYDPKLSLIVKNNPSHIDPVYTEKNNGYRETLPNIDIKKNDKVDLYSIAINGKKVPFSFKSITESKTAGGAKFHSCLDICLDHFYGVAKSYLASTLRNASTIFTGELLSSQCTHIVTSNCINLYKLYSVGNVTHADPVYSKINSKQGATLLRESPINNTFGDSLRAFITSPVACSKLPSYEQSLVNDHNNKILYSNTLGTNVKPKPTVFTPKPFAYFAQTMNSKPKAVYKSQVEDPEEFNLRCSFPWRWSY